MRVAILGVFVFLGLSCVSWADCIGPDGRVYPTGTRFGPFVCQDDGTWR